MNESTSFSILGGVVEQCYLLMQSQLWNYNQDEEINASLISLIGRTTFEVMGCKKSG
jgi:hypothetical protein